MNRPRASTTATRRYRANRENRDRENRARIMGRIGEGARPRQSTLQKYNILPAEVDAARMVVGLDPLYEDNNYQSTTTLQNINEATQREIDEVAKQQRLIVELEQNQDKLWNCSSMPSVRTKDASFVFVRRCCTTSMS